MRFAELPEHFRAAEGPDAANGTAAPGPAAGLVRSHRKGRLPHAMLFLGPEGNGALPLARAMAQYLNCQEPSESDSCGSCPSCQKASKGIHPDIHYSYPFLSVASGPKSQQKRQSGDWAAQWRQALTDTPYMGYADWTARMADALGSSNKQANIPVEEVQAMQRKLSLKTFEGGFKVMILWLPEYLGKEGNRILKLIEEPPAKTVFLLVAEDADHILGTILSRTQILRVPRMPDASIASALQARGLSAETAATTAMLSDGNFRQALLAVGAQSAGATIQEKDGASSTSHAHEAADFWRQWLQAVAQWNVLRFFPLLDAFHKMGREAQKQVFAYAIQRVRQCWYHALGVPNAHATLAIGKDQTSRIGVSDAEAALLPPAGWERLRADLEKAQHYIERNAHARLVMTNLGIRLSRHMQQYRQTQSQQAASPAGEKTGAGVP